MVNNMAQSQPLDSCTFCNRVCEFRIPANAVVMSQMKFLIDSLSFLREGKIGRVSKEMLNKAADLLKETPTPDSMDQRALAYCIMAHIVEDLNLDSDIKNIVMKSVKNSLLDAFKNLLNKDAKIQTKIKSSPSERTEQDQMKIEREKIRAGQGKGKSASSSKTDVSNVDSIGKQIFNWLQNDKKFLKIIDKNGIKKIKNGFLVVFDPESEGYLGQVRVLYANKSFNLGDSQQNITKIRMISEYDVKYNMDAAIGFNKKGKPMAQTYYGLPESKDELNLSIDEVNKKNIMDWDSLKIILNNDKRLLKNLKSLPLKSPMPSNIDDIIVPATIKHMGAKMGLEITFFFNNNVRPSKIFLGIMEAMAEDVDNLHDIDESVRSKTASESNLFVFDESVGSKSHQFISTAAPIEIPTCPSCGRPFPDPLAEYRRCPHCLFKLM